MSATMFAFGMYPTVVRPTATAPVGRPLPQRCRKNVSGLRDQVLRQSH
jgi:hypothetical protein